MHLSPLLPHALRQTRCTSLEEKCMDANSGVSSFQYVWPCLLPAFNAQDIRLITDRNTGQSKGYAFITMGSQDECHAAIQGANGCVCTYSTSGCLLLCARSCLHLGWAPDCSSFCPPVDSPRLDATGPY